MVLQVLALLAIVAFAVVWFVRDEQARRDLEERKLALAYAKIPRRRLAFEKVDPTLPTPMRRPVLSEDDLKLVASLGRGA